MGVWDEQHWPHSGEVEAWRAECATVNAELRTIRHKLSLLRGVCYGDEKTALRKRESDAVERLMKLKEKLRDANLILQHEKVAQFGLDPNDPRLLLAKAHHFLKKLHQGCKARGGTFTDEEYALMTAIDLYVSYRARTPQGKVAWVARQIEH
jgi:hypothetical protein